MGTAKRKPHPPLVEQLLQRPGAFDFFRAAQVLEEALDRSRGRRGRKPIGFDHSSAEVGVLFDAVPSLAFADRPIRSVTAAEDEGPAFEMQVSFLGLIGPAGSLPSHYTEILLKRLQERDTALRDYLHAFQDRSIALFYRAWKKYRLAVSFKDGDLARGRPDPVLETLLALAGLLPHQLGAPLGPGRLVQTFHAGLFSDRRRSASALRAMISGLLGCEVEVHQFVGQWIRLDPAACARLGRGPGPRTQAQLGDVTVLGDRVWSVDARIRIVAGPLDRDRFRELWPGGEPVRYLREAIRAFLGPLIECDLIWKLDPQAPTAIELGGDQRLGRDCWLGWGEIGGPETRVSSPPWHNATPAGNPSESTLTPAGSP